MESRVAKNYIYNLIYQIAVLIIPLITAPYLARILGADGVGIYSYHYSIAYYFCLFVMLGINNYGNRTVARCLGDINKINKVFSELYFIQFSLGIIMLAAYIVYAFFICSETFIALCYVPFIVSYMLDVNWLFFGQENFKIILIRNIAVKILTALAIFILVKSSSDVVVYIIISSVGALLSQVFVWTIVFRKNRFVKFSVGNAIRHIKPIAILFIPVIAVSIYRTMDKIMLGSLSNMEQVGFYENAEKIVSILLSFITALGTVMLPRMSALYENKDENKISRMLEYSFVFVSLAASVVAFGVASVADNLVVVYYGSDYLPSGIILKLLCITVPFISYANIMRMQILVPQGKDKAYVLSCFAGAAVNLLLNSLLIPHFQAVGAAIGTIAAEFAVLFVQILFAKNEIYIKEFLKNIICFWVNGLIMGVIVFFIDRLISSTAVSLVVQILCGAVIYMLLLLLQWKLFKDRYVNAVIQKIFMKAKKCKR